MDTESLLEIRKRLPSKPEFTVFVHPDAQSQLVLSTWPINVFPDEFGREGERVVVKRGKKHYALVFHNNSASVEIFKELDEEGMLGDKETVILP